jgi:hypothetical protein
MAGLVPAIHVLLQRRAQIVPFSIEAIHQPDKPGHDNIGFAGRLPPAGEG